MNTKERKVKLVVPATGKEQELTITHAERLLGMGTTRNGGWELPKDSIFYYDSNYGIRFRTDKADSAKTSTQADD